MPRGGLGRILSRTAIHLGRRSPPVSSTLPVSFEVALLLRPGGLSANLFGLAPRRVYLISLQQIFIPVHSFCCTGPHLAVGGRYPLRCHVVSRPSSRLFSFKGKKARGNLPLLGKMKVPEKKSAVNTIEKNTLKSGSY